MVYKTKTYVIGTPKSLDTAFPNYAGDDVRKSLDGKQAIYEVNVSTDELVKLKKNLALKIYSHSEILTLVNAPGSAGIWYPKNTETIKTPEPTNEP